MPTAMDSGGQQRQYKLVCEADEEMDLNFLSLCTLSTILTKLMLAPFQDERHGLPVGSRDNRLR